MEIVKKAISSIVKWSLSDDHEAPAIAISQTIGVGCSSEPTFRLGVVNAMNGKAIEISTYKRNPNGPDWTSQLFLVPEHQTLAEAITMVLVLKNIA
jgi:hypothetical protein